MGCTENINKGVLLYKQPVKYKRRDELETEILLLKKELEQYKNHYDIDEVMSVITQDISKDILGLVELNPIQDIKF